MGTNKVSNAKMNIF